MLDTNLWGVIHGVRAFVPLILAAGEEGHIVNTSSMAAVLALRGSGRTRWRSTAYSVSATSSGPNWKRSALLSA